MQSCAKLLVKAFLVAILFFLPLSGGSICIDGGPCNGSGPAPDSCGPGSCGCHGVYNEAGRCTEWVPSVCCMLYI